MRDALESFRAEMSRMRERLGEMEAREMEHRAKITYLEQQLQQVKVQLLAGESRLAVQQHPTLLDPPPSLTGQAPSTPPHFNVPHATAHFGTMQLSPQQQMLQQLQLQLQLQQQMMAAQARQQPQLLIHQQPQLLTHQQPLLTQPQPQQSQQQQPQPIQPQQPQQSQQQTQQQQAVLSRSELTAMFLKGELTASSFEQLLSMLPQ